MSGVVVWITGLPASGKSTLATRLKEKLEPGAACCILDSDELRNTLTPSPGYDERGRDDFYTTVAGLAALLAQQGLIVLVAATANRQSCRERARELAPRFLEVFVDVPVEECAERDPKGLYAAAKSGAIGNLPGVRASYEAPAAPDVVAQGGFDQAALERITELCGRG